MSKILGKVFAECKAHDLLLELNWNGQRTLWSDGPRLVPLDALDDSYVDDALSFVMSFFVGISSPNSKL